MLSVKKQKLANADTSSSDEEISIDALKEATDHQLFNKDLFSSKKKTQPEEVNVEDDYKSKLKSLRSDIHRIEKFENFGVSQPFKDFVAKKLDDILNKSIKLRTVNDLNTDNKEKEESKEFGIKLLSTSKELLSVNEHTENMVLRKKLPKSSSRLKVYTKDNISDLQKFQEAAVSPEWVLSKKDTKAWVNKRSDLELKYKRLKNGILIEQK